MPSARSRSASPVDRAVLRRAAVATAIAGTFTTIGATVYLASREIVSPWTAVAWQGATYAAWVPLAVAIAWVLDRTERAGRPWVGRLLAWWPATLLHGMASAVFAWLALQGPRDEPAPLGSYLAGHLAQNLPVEILQYWAIVAMLALIETRRRLHDRERAVARLEAEVAHAQLAMLRARLQPHFLFNTLQSISMLIPRDPVAAQRMTLHLGDLLRAAFERGDAQEVRLADELALVRAYVEIEAQRFRDRLTVRWSVEGAPDDACVPDLLLQPLVENALRHGLWPRPGHGTLTVRARTVADGDRTRLLLEVQDDGVGLPPGWHDGSLDGTGLGATRARLLALHGEEARLDVGRATGAGTLARIALPLRRRA
jgi:signal transduction histidine kinase